LDSEFAVRASGALAVQWSGIRRGTCSTLWTQLAKEMEGQNVSDDIPKIKVAHGCKHIAVWRDGAWKWLLPPTCFRPRPEVELVIEECPICKAEAEKERSFAV
jgi:hypothetical protein